LTTVGAFTTRPAWGQRLVRLTVEISAAAPARGPTPARATPGPLATTPAKATSPALVTLTLLDPANVTARRWGGSECVKSRVFGNRGKRRLKQTTRDWDRSIRLETRALPGSLRSRRQPEAAKGTTVVTPPHQRSITCITLPERNVTMALRYPLSS